MTRQDIGSYLGVTLETVSRTLSSFHAARLIDVDQRTIRIHDIKALRMLRRLSPIREKPSSDNVSPTVSEINRIP
jgi:CRP/FNR family transcriptional regulator